MQQLTNNQLVITSDSKSVAHVYAHARLQRHSSNVKASMHQSRMILAVNGTIPRVLASVMVLRLKSVNPMMIYSTPSKTDPPTPEFASLEEYISARATYCGNSISTKRPIDDADADAMVLCLLKDAPAGCMTTILATDE